MTKRCYPCANNARLDELPPRERIVVQSGWRVAHAFNTTLRGWLVAIPLQHIERFAELDDDEVRALGPLARACARALEEQLGCAKTYLVQLGETEGMEHVHLHVIPRMRHLGDDVKGTNVFSLLDRPESEWIPQDERDALSAALRQRIEALL